MDKTKGIFIGIVSTVLLTVLIFLIISSSITAARKNSNFIIWQISGPETPQSSMWKNVADKFQKAHPDLKVVREFKTWDEINLLTQDFHCEEKCPNLIEWRNGDKSLAELENSSMFTDLGDYSQIYGWQNFLNPTFLEIGRFENGKMGSGELLGIPTYGEYVGWFYNSDLLEKFKIDPNKINKISDLENAFKRITDAGSVPISASTNMLVDLGYTLTLTNADQEWVDSYQFLQNSVDFNGYEFIYSSEKLKAWSELGFFENNNSQILNEDESALSAFLEGDYPFLFGNSSFDEQISNHAMFRWNKFLNPQNKIYTASAGNLWVVPRQVLNQDLSAEFINLTLTFEFQNELQIAGGIPLLANIDSTEMGTSSSDIFYEISAKNGLGLYPGWPVSGYSEVLNSATSGLISGSITPEEYRMQIGDFYHANKP